MRALWPEADHSADAGEAATPRLAWYGDDFTGASDTLATVAQAGLRAMLFCGVPTAEHYRRAGPLDAFGIAGAARSMAPEAMRAELALVGPVLAASGARVLHYKCCSTFDSAPHIGSIGVAVESLRRFAPGQPVLIVGGQPGLGRFCVSGELYAVAQRGGRVYRIDRHPTMSRHPVTPMQDGDLRVHLGRQGLDNIALVDLQAYESPEKLDAAVDALAAPGDAEPGAVLFDVAAEEHLAPIGRIISSRAQRSPVLVVGASSVAQSLIDYWGMPRQARDGAVAPARGPVLVLAGSLSPVTARQIGHALRYARVPLMAARLAADANYLGERARHIADLLASGKHVLAHTSPIEHEQGSLAGDVASLLAPATGALLRAILRRTKVGRVGIAGGDTSSRTVQALEAWGLEWIGQIDVGVPLLRVHADDPRIDGLELMLKGGQMGGKDLFDRLIA